MVSSVLVIETYISLNMNEATAEIPPPSPDPSVSGFLAYLEPTILFQVVS